MSGLSRVERKKLIAQKELELAQEAAALCKKQGHVLAEPYEYQRLAALSPGMPKDWDGKWLVYECLVCDTTFSVRPGNELVSPYFSNDDIDDKGRMYFA